MPEKKQTPATNAKTTPTDDQAAGAAGSDDAAEDAAAEAEAFRAKAAKRIGKISLPKTEKDGTPIRKDGSFVMEEVACRPEHVIGFSIERNTAVTLDGVKHSLSA